MRSELVTLKIYSARHTAGKLKPATQHWGLCFVGRFYYIFMSLLN